MKWLICFSVVNLVLGYLLFKKFKKLMNLVHCQEQLERHQHILIKLRFVKLIFIKPLRFVKNHANITNYRNYRRTHGYYIDKIMIKWVCDVAKRKRFLSSFLVMFRLVLIENEIYCYIEGFLKWNISKKTSYIFWKDFHS